MINNANVYITHKGVELLHKPMPLVLNINQEAQSAVWEDFKKPPAERRCLYTPTPDGQGWETKVEVNFTQVTVRILAARVVSEANPW